MADTTPNRVLEALSRAPTDLPGLLAAYGLGYEESILRGSSAIVVPRNGSGKVFIEVNATDPEPAKRIALAYEIARWVMARDKFLSQSQGRRTPGQSKPVRHDSPFAGERGVIDASTGIETRKILRMALEILVPKHQLKQILSENGGDVRDAARRFMVSDDTIRQKAIKSRFL